MTSWRRWGGAVSDGVGATVSTLVTFTVGTAVQPALGAGLILGGALAVALLAAGRAETTAVRALTRARNLRDYESASLRPAIAVLEEFDLTSPAVGLLVREGQPAIRVTAIGRRTVVVSEGLVTAIATRRVRPDEAAAVLAHAIGRIRLGQTRYDVALAFWLLPWTFLQAIAAGASRAIRCHQLIAFAWRLRFITAAVALIQGVTEGRPVFGVIGALAVAVTYLIPWAARHTYLAEEDAADQFVTDTGLGDTLGRYLERGRHTPRARQRIHRLRSTHADRPPVAT